MYCYEWTTKLLPLVSLLLSVLCVSLTMTICPTPLPCHCIGNQVVYCAFLRLAALPYFLDFKQSWQELDVSENFIAALPAGGLRGVRARLLKLNRNSVRSIAAGAFVGVEDLAVLDLSHNYLRDLPPAVFAPLVDLRTLRLAYNQLTAIGAGAFDAIPHLYELDLQGNDLAAVPSRALAAVRRLRRVNLRNNRLRTIDAYAFAGLALEVIDAGDNTSPMAVHRDAFCGLAPRVVAAGGGVEPSIIEWSGLHTLLLDHNGLTTLNPCITRTIWTLHVVDVSGNPLRCDCRLLSIRGDFGASSSAPASRTTFPGAQCAFPERLAGQYLADVVPAAYREECAGGGRNDTTEGGAATACWESCQSKPSTLGYWSGVRRLPDAGLLLRCLILAYAALRLSVVGASGGGDCGRRTTLSTPAADSLVR